jgi:hypothetical protein
LAGTAQPDQQRKASQAHQTAAIIPTMLSDTLAQCSGLYVLPLRIQTI